ncbi:MAG: hypothetical protein WA354_03220 [Terracidiphilus sp.]
MKRTTVAILFGLIAGLICASGAFYGHLLKFSAVMLLWVLLNRAVMGFAIGISGLRVHWAWNGPIIGLAVGSIFSYFLFLNLGQVLVPVVNFFVNALFGLMIEFFTTKVFKQAASSVPVPAVHIAAVHV